MTLPIPTARVSDLARRPPAVRKPSADGQALPRLVPALDRQRNPEPPASSLTRPRTQARRRHPAPAGGGDRRQRRARGGIRRTRRGPFPAPAAGAAVVAGQRADAGGRGTALVVDPRAGAALHRGRDDTPRPRVGPPRYLPAAPPPFVRQLAGDLVWQGGVWGK